MDLYGDMSRDPLVISYLENDDIAKEFYAALCNVDWTKIVTVPDDEKIIQKLKGQKREIWNCSWRFAGGIISDIRNKHFDKKECYMDFYCSGNEGTVSDLVRECLERMGWEPLPDSEE